MAADQVIVSVPLNHLCPHCIRALAERPPTDPGVLLLPLTGKRGGRRGVVIGWAKVADDAFSREILSPLNWNLQPPNRHAGGYVTRRGPRVPKGEKRQTCYLHVMVAEHYFGAVPPGMVVDHCDRDKLNCLPSNLRITTQRINCLNRGLQKSNTSGYIGVCLFRHPRRPHLPPCWKAQGSLNGRRISLGYHATPEEAAAAVNRHYQEHHPEVPIPNPTVPT